MRNKITMMAAVVLERDAHHGHIDNIGKDAKKKKEIFRVIEGISAITIITLEEFLPLIKKYFKYREL